METLLEDMAQRVRSAARDGRPLRIVGGGSKDGYGQALHGEVLSTRDWAGIVSYEPSELVVTVRCGTPLAALEAALAEQGQCLPFEPPHHLPGSAAESSRATCGGMLAAGLSGPARANAGAVRDFVLGLHVLNGRGELLRFGGQVMKNVAGYDVSRLMAGSMGTLGLITEISLKVLPVAPAEATLRFDWPQDQALRQLHLWGGQPLPLNASCWREGEGLTLRLRGAVAAVDAACRQLGGERVEPAAAAAFWAARRALRMPWDDIGQARDLWRLSVPQTAPVLDLPGVPLVEWHGGQRWLAAAPRDAARVRQAAQAAGGSATLFLAAPGERSGARAACFDPLAPALARIHTALKASFDPAGIFNPGRLVADL
ncbi:glycolate oxidase subunit GlcE [Pseudorhodoferax sp. Leaf267]|uniref:glycolate oxidase subunit GlcE n=1 Tax=Pseudorhodoferax sp. Leaf267 TaxID=1736316 RepID=UPI0006FD16DC|nr:glycolate oxidase subunit GlcE [Pseudorhodoferax sp. Leaf267]KQP11890.1 glycolate oxidase [Pseudorhodoferax sp. Leaf267]